MKELEVRQIIGVRQKDAGCNNEKSMRTSKDSVVNEKQEAKKEKKFGWKCIRTARGAFNIGNRNRAT